MSKPIVMRKKKRWYSVVVTYATEGGDMRVERSEPIGDFSIASGIRLNFIQTGIDARVVEVPAPPKPKPPGEPPSLKLDLNDDPPDGGDFHK